ncbi:TPA: hypothetical protein ACH3X2_009663 [Trebouxia sp. C0005]
MLLACLEYWLEVTFCSIIKVQVISKAGLAGIVTGELIRKTAMVTCTASHIVCFPESS